ncbi:MAG: hypothetical protein ABSF00_05495 [Candidatus Bathyarchaeia archaeon]
MGSMKILAFSDVVKWEGYEERVDRIRPDVVALVGDLTSDGGAAFWYEHRNLNSHCSVASLQGYVYR